jgi:hypothetical protein
MCDKGFHFKQLIFVQPFMQAFYADQYKNLSKAIHWATHATRTRIKTMSIGSILFGILYNMQIRFFKNEF